MSDKKIIKGKSGVAFYEYTSWAHRYKKIDINGKIKLCKKKGFKTEEEAIESYNKYKKEKREEKEEMKYCFGVDIGGTTVKMGLFEENGTILDKWEITTDTSEEGKYILPNIAASIENKIEEHKIAKEDIAGIGAGVPAPVTSEGVVNGSANLGWTYKEVKKELEELTGLKAAIGNDANVAALGEMWKGGGAGEKNMIMVTLGTGVGGGVIIDGKILVGQNGAGGETDDPEQGGRHCKRCV